MKANRIEAIEKEIPTEEGTQARIMERTEAAIERDLRELSPPSRARADQFLPAAAELAESEEGREVIAFLLHAYYERLNAKPPPEPTVGGDVVEEEDPGGRPDRGPRGRRRRRRGR